MSGEDFGRLNHERAVEALRARHRKSQDQQIDELVADLLEAKDLVIEALQKQIANRDARIATLEEMVRMDLETIDRMVARARDAA